MNTLHAFHFLYPAWLLALPPLLLLAAWLAWRERRSGGWSSLVDAELLSVLKLQESGRRHSIWGLVAVCWTLAVCALASPSWQRQASTAFQTPDSWILVLDLSPSMNAADLAPDRVTRARYVISDLLNAAHGARVALVAFAGEAHTVTPITTDVATVRSLLQPLTPAIMPESGDQLAPALDEAARLLKDGGVTHSQVIVLTDGFSDPAQALSAAQRLRQQGASVNVIGIGTASGAPLHHNQGAFVRDSSGHNVLTRLDSDPLQRVATTGSGRYVPLNNASDLVAQLQAEPTALFNESTATNSKQVTTWLNGGFWLLPVLLLFAALMARRGWL